MSLIPTGIKESGFKEFSSSVCCNSYKVKNYKEITPIVFDPNWDQRNLIPTGIKGKRFQRVQFVLTVTKYKEITSIVFDPHWDQRNRLQRVQFVVTVTKSEITKRSRPLSLIPTGIKELGFKEFSSSVCCNSHSHIQCTDPRTELSTMI